MAALGACAQSPSWLERRADGDPFSALDPAVRLGAVGGPVLREAATLCGRQDLAKRKTLARLGESASTAGGPVAEGDQPPATGTHAFSIMSGGVGIFGDAPDEPLRSNAAYSLAEGIAPNCYYALEYASRPGVNAFAEMGRIKVTKGMVRYATRDAELAFVVAHEVAHNLLGHRPPAGEDERQRLELEADYVGLYLVARAGYDVRVASRLLRRMAGAFPKHVSASVTHPSFSGRYEAMIRAVEEIAAKGARGMPIIPERGPFAQVQG